MIRYMLAIILLPAILLAGEYKDYSFSRQQSKFIELQYNEETEKITFTGFDQLDTLTISGTRNTFKKHNNTILLDGQLLIDEAGFHIQNRLFPFEQITDSRITYQDGRVTLTFLKKETTEAQLYTFKRGNLIEVTPKTSIDTATFIRGMLFNPIGTIDIKGEVSKDVITFFGDVKLHNNAVVRGDVFSLAGRISSEGVNSIYGVLFEPFHGIFGKEHITDRTGNKFAFMELLRYNRVDGLLLGGKAEYTDYDSLIPTITVELGYAFESERLRYSLTVEQTLLKDPHLVLGGSFYQQLLSEDTNRITELENTLFALLMTEDYRDYYEARGGSIYFKAYPRPAVSVSLGYAYYETNWLKAHRNLWSLIGGDKLFDQNFGSVADPYRTIGINEIDQSANGYLFATARYYTVHDEEPYNFPGWNITAYFELASDGLQSDFAYSRYTLSAGRVQPINRFTTLLVAARLGNSDGYVPMYKRFFIGGLSSLEGYDHKEYMGTRFWQTKTEYRIQFPRTEFACGLIWEMAQIANDTKLNGDIEIKQSLGLALYSGNSVKLTLAKRFDRSDDDSPKIYLRLQATP